MRLKFIEEQILVMLALRNKTFGYKEKKEWRQVASAKRNKNGSTLSTFEVFPLTIKLVHQPCGFE
jgi:hypothetical protein